MLAPCRVNEDATGEVRSTRLPTLLTSRVVPQLLPAYTYVGTADQRTDSMAKMGVLLLRPKAGPVQADVTSWEVGGSCQLSKAVSITLYPNLEGSDSTANTPGEVPGG